MWNPGGREELGVGKRKDITMCTEGHQQRLMGKERKQPMFRVVNYPSVRYLDPQLGSGHPCTRTSSVLYFLIRYLDPKVQ